MARKKTIGIVHFAPGKNGATEEDEKAIEVSQVCFDRILSWQDVHLVTGLSRPTVWRLERDGRFPSRVQISSSRVGWVGSEIQQWIQSRPRVGLTECKYEGVAKGGAQ